MGRHLNAFVHRALLAQAQKNPEPAARARPASTLKLSALNLQTNIQRSVTLITFTKRYNTKNTFYCAISQYTKSKAPVLFSKHWRQITAKTVESKFY